MNIYCGGPEGGREGGWGDWERQTSVFRQIVNCRGEGVKVLNIPERVFSNSISEKDVSQEREEIQVLSPSHNKS